MARRTIFEEHHADRLSPPVYENGCLCTDKDKSCLYFDAKYWSEVEDHRDYLEWRPIIDSARRIIVRLTKEIEGS